MANTITTLDRDGDVGMHSSVTIGADGLGLISYYDATNADLKVAHCSDAACSSATITTLDSVFGTLGPYPSVTIGVDGLGLISYYDGKLKVAHCDNVVCSSANITTLGLDDRALAADGHAKYTSVAIGSDGLGLIVYDYRRLAHITDLKVAHCDNIECSSATDHPYLETLVHSDGPYTSVTTGADGLGLISYRGSEGFLKVAHCDNIECSSANITNLSNLRAKHSSVTIGADGLGLISYYANHELKAAHCSDSACSSATLTTLDSEWRDINNTGDLGNYSSVTIGADGLGLISYYDATNADLKVAHCSDAACSSATTITLDSDEDVGMYTSVTIGADGLGLISYYDATHGDLKVAHCANRFCTPNFRRR